MEERSRNLTNSVYECCPCCVKQEDVKPVCKEEVDNAPITGILSVKLEPHTDIEHPHTSGEKCEVSHWTTSDMPTSVQSGVGMLGSVLGAGDIQKVSSCIRKITNMMDSIQRAIYITGGPNMTDKGLCFCTTGIVDLVQEVSNLKCL
jgi:hypothetical protein